jgi:hypothetical protein
MQPLAIRYSMRMQSSKSSVAPLRICRKAIFMLVGDLVRMVWTVLRAQSSPSASSAATISSTESRPKASSMRSRWAASSLSPGSSANSRITRPTAVRAPRRYSASASAATSASSRSDGR